METNDLTTPKDQKVCLVLTRECGPWNAEICRGFGGALTGHLFVDSLFYGQEGFKPPGEEVMSMSRDDSTP
jgi:hypothetical protein